MTGGRGGPPELADHPFLQGLAPSLIDRLRPAAKLRQFRTDELLFREGGEADTLYLLVSGKVALELGDSGSSPRILQTLGAGDLLGWSWLTRPYRWRLDARVVKGGEGFALDAATVRDLLRQQPEEGLALVLRILPIVGDRLEHARLQLLDLYAR